MMSYHQYKLFDYTRASELLTGDDVIQADRTKQKIKLLQSKKKLADNVRLDMYYRDPTLIDDVIVMKLERGGALASHERYAIAVVIQPLGIKGYEIPIAFFEHRKDAEAMLDTVRAYLTHRYGV